MVKASDNAFPSILVVEGTTPTSPASGDQRLFVDSADHKLKRVNSSGTVTTVEGGAALNSYAKAIRSAALTVAGSSTWNYIAWDAEESDTDSYHDTVTNNSRLTIPVTGLYLVGYDIAAGAAAGGSGRWASHLLKNGDISTGTKMTGGADEFDMVSGNVPVVSACTMLSLTAADWLQVAVLNSTSAGIAMDTSTSTFWIHRLS